MNQVTAFLRHHQKTLGILILLGVLVGVTGLRQPMFLQADALKSTLHYTGLFGILAVAAAMVIVTGGIDLSMGSLIAMSGVLLPMLLTKGALFFTAPVSMPVALLIVLGLGALIGMIHGLLITKLNLQPFLVTLCGLFIYRSFARTIAKDESADFGAGFPALDQLKEGMMPFYVLIALAVISGIFLHRTVWGRHILALGRNEQAARFSGIATDTMKIVCYVLCGMITAFGGMMCVLDDRAALPSNFGNSYELYAIAGAVLGGCSLRGGECSMAGVVCGAALVQFSVQAALFLGVPDSWKLAVIGFLILIGVIADELFRRFSARRKVS